jgi:hypothetical protein
LTDVIDQIRTGIEINVTVLNIKKYMNLNKFFAEHEAMTILKHIFVATATCFAACALNVSVAIAAQDTIYKSIDAKGEVTYSARTQPDAVHTETIKIETLSPEERRAAKHLRLEEAKIERRDIRNANALNARWQQVDKEISNALAGVQKAEKNLKSGRTPLPGERRGNVGGGSRLTQAYFDRIHQLELSVKEAKQRLDKAYQARNDLP